MVNKNSNGQKFKNIAYCRLVEPTLISILILGVQVCGITSIEVNPNSLNLNLNSILGEKIFWFIPPTKKNFELFQKWTLSGAQNREFFGDNVDDCQRIKVKKGETLLMPAGWIHAVYTPCDTINFGGNFLHGLSMVMQVRVVEMEEKLKVPNREKFPHFWPLMWYVADAYCQTVTPQHKLLQQ